MEIDAGQKMGRKHMQYFQDIYTGITRDMYQYLTSQENGDTKKKKGQRTKYVTMAQKHMSMDNMHKHMQIHHRGRQTTNTHTIERVGRKKQSQERRHYILFGL